jgi:hypothetical protein
MVYCYIYIYIGSNNEIFESLKQLFTNSIVTNSYKKKIGWEGKNSSYTPLVIWLRLIILNIGKNSIPIVW